MTISRLACLAAIFCAATACGDDATTGGGGEGGEPTTGGSGGQGGQPTTGGGGEGGEGGGGGGDGFDWEACPVFSGGSGFEAECVTVEVPLAYSDPDGATIDVSMKRISAASQPARGQLWMLYGGPGGSVAGLEPIADFLSGTNDDLDIYLLEHRGVGTSTRLGCSEQEDPESEAGFYVTEAELPACLANLQDEWGDGLAEFSTSNAARDLGRLVDLTRQGDQEVIVYGISYGTMWAHRYLQIFPEQPTAVALDSICAPNCDFSIADQWFDDVAEKLLDACGEDAECSTKLGADPWATFTQALAGLETGACPEVAAMGFDRKVFQQVIARSLYSFYDRMMAPALAYRLARCSAADVNAFAHLAAFYSTPPSPTLVEELDSGMLGANIGLSELWPDDGPTPAEAELAEQTLNVANGVTSLYARTAEYWPRYELDEYAGVLAESDVAMLMLQGQDDFIPASWVEPVRQRFDGANQTFVSLPRTTHGAVGSSPSEPVGFPCGLEIMRRFFADPSTPPDTSCRDFILPYDFTFDPNASQQLFGTADAWEGDPGPVPNPRPLPRTLPRRPHF